MDHAKVLAKPTRTVGGARTSFTIDTDGSPKENELELIQNSGSTIIHCASSALEKAQGCTTISKIQNQGISVGFGLEQTNYRQRFSQFI